MGEVASGEEGTEREILGRDETAITESLLVIPVLLPAAIGLLVLRFAIWFQKDEKVMRGSME